MIIQPERLEFVDAIDAALARNVLLPVDYYGERMRKAKARGFTAKGLRDIEQIRTVFDTLNDSIRKGESFAEWKARIADKGIALPASRLEMIFRNNMQNAYSAGRWRQMVSNNPDVYLMYDSINDSRTRPTHRAWDGIILRASDPFWRTHYPPNGHNCRCSVIALTEAQARKRGITDPAKLSTLPAPDNGWDYNAGLDDEIDLEILKRTAVERRPDVSLPILSKVEPKAENAKRTLDEYIELGRTSTAELFEIGRLQDETYAESAFATLKEKLKTARGKAALSLVKGSTGSTIAKNAAQVFPADWIDASNNYSVPLTTKASKSRASFALGKFTDVLKVRSFDSTVHELAHRLQRVMPDLDDYFQQLHVKRTEGDKLKLMSVLKPGHRYGYDELAKEDDYIDPYFGKQYKFDDAWMGRAGALELMTMSLQYMLAGRKDFIKLAKDEELFHLTIGLLLHYVP